MVNYGVIFGLLFLAVIFSQANAYLKCWRCSSDGTNAEFCNDPFDPNKIPEQQKVWSYVNCTAYASVNTRPACKKVVQEVYGRTVVSRSCFWEDYTDPADKCQTDNVPANTKMIFCRTCTTDGCNSAGSLLPVVPFVLAPIAFAKLLSI